MRSRRHRKRDPDPAHTQSCAVGERDLRALPWERAAGMPGPHACPDRGALRRVLRAFVAYVNRARPHQGIGQAIPAEATPVESQGVGTGRILAFSILGGLHQDYRRAA